MHCILQMEMQNMHGCFGLTGFLCHFSISTCVHTIEACTETTLGKAVNLLLKNWIRLWIFKQYNWLTTRTTCNKTTTYTVITIIDRMLLSQILFDFASHKQPFQLWLDCTSALMLSASSLLLSGSYLFIFSCLGLWLPYHLEVHIFFCIFLSSANDWVWMFCSVLTMWCHWIFIWSIMSLDLLLTQYFCLWCFVFMEIYA